MKVLRTLGIVVLICSLATSSSPVDDESTEGNEGLELGSGSCGDHDHGDDIIVIDSTRAVHTRTHHQKGGIVAGVGVDQAVDADQSIELVTYQQPASVPSQSADTTVYIIIVWGTLVGICIIFIIILLLYICKISRRPQAGPETSEMRSA